MDGYDESEPCKDIMIVYKGIMPAYRCIMKVYKDGRFRVTLHYIALNTSPLLAKLVDTCPP